MKLVDIAKVTVGGRVTLPRVIRTSLGIKEGDRVKVYINERRIILEKLEIK
jgi:AbrB family looped-hinge helix DNA binding protein